MSENDTDHNGKPETDSQFLRYIANVHLSGRDWSMIEHARIRRIARELAEHRAAAPEISEERVEKMAEVLSDSGYGLVTVYLKNSVRAALRAALKS